jgi:hypothetical protein
MQFQSPLVAQRIRSYPPCHARCLIAQGGARRIGPVGLNRSAATAMGILALSCAAGKSI